jgi:hypothetical protein
MIIQVPADAPLVVKAAAAAVLWTHIGGASLGLVSGTVAILAKKGDRLHRLAGNVFFGAMLAMGLAGGVSAPFLPDMATSIMGFFVAYLAATAWLAVKTPPATVGRFDRAALAVGAATAVAYAWIAVRGAMSPGGLIDGKLPYTLAVFFGSLCGLSALLDLKALRAGGLAGTARLRRHLWRMSLALAIAWGSFAGQPRAQPELVRGAPWLFLPALACLALLAFWMIRTRGPRRARRTTAPAAA